MSAPSPPQPAALTAWLRGRWEVRRVINGGAGRFAGTATFHGPGDELVWHEHGHMHLGGYDGVAERTYRIVADGDRWEVRFADGRPFHPLDLSTGQCDAVHHCGEDVYRGRYRAGGDRLDVDWQITGPGKDDRIVCTYRRL